MSSALDRAREAGLRLRVVKAADAAAALRKDAPPPAPGAPAPAPAAASPTLAQTTFQEIPITIDRPRGHVMNGIDEKGEAWKRAYYVDYGFIPNTQGGDAEGLDVFLGLHPDATEAHWIKQLKSDGTFDEYKLMLGFGSADEAKGMYLAHVPKRFFGEISTTSVGMVRGLLGLHPNEVTKALSAFALPSDGSAPVAKRDAGVARNVRLAKAEGTAKQQYLLGIVLEPEVTDGQGDIYSADEVRKAAWDWMTANQNIGLMHKKLVNGKVQLVESYIAPTDMNVGGSVIKAGTWLMGMYVRDAELWADIEAGRLTGLSIGGFASKNPA